MTPRQLREHPKHRKHPKQPSKRTRIPQPSAPPKACPPPDDEYGFSPESVFRNGSSTSCASGSGRRSIERSIEERSIGVGSGPFSVRVPHIPTTVGGFGLNANEYEQKRTNANKIRTLREEKIGASSEGAPLLTQKHPKACCPANFRDLRTCGLAGLRPSRRSREGPQRPPSLIVPSRPRLRGPSGALPPRCRSHDERAPYRARRKGKSADARPLLRRRDR